MARNILGIFQKIWAQTGDRDLMPDFENGYGAEYESSELPQRTHLNDVLAKTTAVAYDINKYGAGLPWDTGLLYAVGAIVMGTDGVYYIAQQENQGQDPTAAGNVPSVWRVYSVLSKFVPITDYSDSAGAGLVLEYNKPANADYIYSIEDFEGSGLIPSAIKSVFVEVDWDQASFNMYANYGIGENWRLVAYDASQTIDGDKRRFCGAAVIEIPISTGQTEFSLRIADNGQQDGHDGLTFKIFGALQ